MSRQCKYFFLLLWVSYLFIASVLLFTRGFLLSREVQKEKSVCAGSVNLCSTGTSHNVYTSTSGRPTPSKDEEKNTGHCRQDDVLKNLIYEEDKPFLCLPPKSKVVLIVIDALKFDFASYDESLQESELQPYQNKLTLIHDLLKTRPNQSRLYKFIADPPTTTMQRLKGLTTGSLPTFIDLGSNFATPEINEDNLLDQLMTQNKSIVFLGDDTWTSLYPNRFIREYAFPSFNVWDLDTVDAGINNHLLPEIKKNDWNLLIAHFLGVDHCGHRYGPNHSEMSRKLMEVNAMIKTVIDTIDDNTMLFVIGDHGMTSTGDHGGDSEAEVTAAMFVYSAKPLFADFQNDKVSQVDLVPTLATILGLPIPFSNLGTTVLDALPSAGWQSLLPVVWHNVEQMSRYIQKYAEHSNQFSPERITVFRDDYTKLKDQLQHISSYENFTEFVFNATTYLTDLKTMCAEVWIQFDPYSISRGLLLSFLTIFFGYLLIEGLPGDALNKILNGPFLYIGYGSIFLGVACSFVCYSLELVEDVELACYFSGGLLSVFTMFIVVVQNWEAISNHFYEKKKLEDWTSMAGRIVMIFGLCGMFSNSFVVEEASVLSYFLLTMVWILVYNFKSFKPNFSEKAKGTDKQTSAWLKSQLTPVRMKLVAMALCFSFMIRLSQYYWSCREEQADCQAFVTSKAGSAANLLSNRYRNAECLFTLVCVALLATVVRIWLRCCGNLVGFSPTEVIARYGPTVLVVCTGGYWIAQGLPKITKAKLFLPWQLQFLPWVVYIVVIVAVFSLFLRPLCVYSVPKNNNVTYIYGEENKIPLLFNHMKEMMADRGKPSDKSDNCPVVYGLATVYSSVFVVLCLFVFLLISLLLGDVMSPSAVLMFATGGLLLAILSVIRYEKALLVGQLFNVPWSSVICWAFLSSYFFYGTGHQPTFPGIQWDAAFVGTGGQFSTHVLPAVLIGINTFGSQLLLSLGLPLLLVAPFTLRVMLPSLLSVSRFDGKDGDLKNGELVLYQQDGLLYRGMFSLCGKYILICGLRIFVCMLAATIHCRHLMVWKIFAPKLIFEGVGLFVSIPCVLASYLLTVRVTAQIEKLFSSLEKQQR